MNPRWTKKAAAAGVTRQQTLFSYGHPECRSGTTGDFIWGAIPRGAGGDVLKSGV